MNCAFESHETCEFNWMNCLTGIYFLVLSLLYSLPTFAQISYSKTIDLPPLRINYLDLQAVLDKTAFLMESANGSVDLYHEELFLQKDEVRIRISGHKFAPAAATLPQVIHEFSYVAHTASAAPITQIEFRFSDYSRTISIHGNSPHQVDAVSSALRDDFLKLATYIGGHSINMVRIMVLYFLVVFFIFYISSMDKFTSARTFAVECILSRANRYPMVRAL